MAKVVERKNEKKRRPSLSDFRKRTLKGKQQQKRTKNSASGPAPLRRSKRLNPNPDADEIRLPSVPVPACGSAPRRSTRRNSKPNADEIQLPSVPVPASGPAPLQRSTRRKPNPDADEIRLPSVPLPASGPAPLRGSTRRNPNPDNIRHGKPQRKVGFMTDDERVRYQEQVFKSDGFDVELMPDIRACGLIQPRNLSNEKEHSICEKFSKSAIEKYHMLKGRRAFYKSETPQLKFVRVLKAMAQARDRLRYYITFEAEDLADEGKHRTYEALVRIKGPPIDVNFSVMFIREYKPDKGNKVIGIHSASELETQLNSAASMTSQLAILFFSATYPCRFISPLYANLAGKYPKVVFLKVDIDEGHEARDLAACWNISSCPSFFFFKSGKEVDKVVGEDLHALKMKIALHSCKQARGKGKGKRSYHMRRFF